MARTIYGDHQRYFNTYFSAFPGKYFSGDGCFKNEEGLFRITGRVDAFSPDSKYLATGSYDKTSIIWDPNSG